MSVHTSNLVSQITLLTAVNAGSLAWAASVLKSPIGAMGGAIFGAVHVVSKLAIGVGADKVLHLNDPQVDSAAKTLSKALEVLGSYGVAWGVLAVAGYSLTLSHVVSLAVVSIFTEYFLKVCLECCGISFSRKAAHPRRNEAHQQELSQRVQQRRGQVEG